MVKSKAEYANDSSNSSTSSSLSSSSFSNTNLKLANKKQKLYDNHFQHQNSSTTSQNNQLQYTTLNSNYSSTNSDNTNSFLPLYHPAAKNLNNFANMQNLTTMTNVGKLTGNTTSISNNSNLNSHSMDMKCVPNINDSLAGAQAYFRNSTELNAAVHIINSVQQHHNSNLHSSKGNATSLKDRSELMSSRSSNNILNCSSSSSNSGSEMPSGSGMGGHGGPNGGGGEETVKKREIRLLKNREAARECRRKKKEYIKCLENRVSVLETQNKTLIDELKALKELYCQTGDPLQKH